MKQWNKILLETIIQDNLFEQSKQLKTIISKVGSGSSLDQFKPVDTAFFNKLNTDLPQKSDSKYNRIFLRFKSVAQGDERSESNQFRVDQVKNVLNSVVVGGPNYKALSGDPQINSNEWCWFISDAFKTAEDDIVKSDDTGTAFYRVSGIRKDDINRKDLVDKVNPAYGTLSNGSAVFSEKQLPALVKIHQTPAPTPAEEKTRFIRSNQLTDVALLQKVLYGYFLSVMDKIPSQIKNKIIEFKTNNFNASTGWNGNLTDETKTIATFFQQGFSKQYTFNVNNKGIVKIDSQFREALATEWNKIATVQESVVISEQDWSNIAVPEIDNEGELSLQPSVQVTTDTDKKTSSTTGSKKSADSTTSTTVTVKDADNISSAERKKLTNWKTTPVSKNFQLGKTYLIANQWIVQRIWLKDYPEYKIEKSFDSDQEYVAYPLRVLDSNDLSNRYIVYGYTKKSYATTLFDMQISRIDYNKQQIPSKRENIVYHPKWYREKATNSDIEIPQLRKDLTPYFISEQPADEWSPRLGTSFILNSADFEYKKLSRTQKIVGKLYAASAGAGTYEDTYKAGIDMIKSWNELLAVIKYMDLMASKQNAGGWWIPGNITDTKLMKTYFLNTYADMQSFVADAGYTKGFETGVGYKNEQWSGRWLDYVSSNRIYTPGTIRYQGNRWPINSFMSQLYGEFKGGEPEYSGRFAQILEIAGDNLSDMANQIGFQNIQHNIYLVDPRIRNSNSFSVE